MDNNIKIKTMKDDLARIESEPSKLPQQQKSKQQDTARKPATEFQNKTNIQTISQPTPSKTTNPKVSRPTAVNKPSESVVSKPKDNEISELKSLIGRISESMKKKDSTKEQDKNRIAKKESRETKTESKIETQTETEIKDRNKSVETKKIVDEITAYPEYSGPLPATGDKKSETGKTKKSFWSNISEKLRTTSNRQKTYELSKPKSKLENKDIIKNKTEETNKSGILLNKKTETAGSQKESADEEKKTKEFYPEKNEYASPENRLIHGKQEYYSSLRKKIELKEKKDEIKELKSASATKKKVETISQKEEYKKLKKSIIQKYHIKLFSLPWKKIITVSVIILFLVGLTVYYFLSRITPPPPPPPPPIIAGIELKEFDGIQDKIEMTKEDVKKLNIIEIKANEKFSSNKNINVLKLLITNQDNLLPLEEALQAIDVIDTETSANNLPENFLEKLTNDYNLFIFKTKQNRIRLGIAVRSNDIFYLQQIMEGWEEERIENKKMSVVLKPLFVNDRTKEIGKSFEQTEHKGITIRYLNLPDQNTSLDYFIHNDLLVITTSKDNAFQMADLLAGK
jgi:hypothetical protein